MKIFLLLLFLFSSLMPASAMTEERDSYVCEASPEIIAPCFAIRGRLSFWNGTPSARIWPIGSKRLLGIHSDVVPLALREQMMSFDSEAYANFYVCPYTYSKQGHMQFVCIQSWKNLVIRQRER
jgi:hypothetical protein